VLQIELMFPAAHSLKEKRMVLRSLKDRVHRQFNVSIAEVDDHDMWQSGVLAVAVVSTDKSHANQVLSKVVEHIEQEGDLILQDYRIQMI
jgi:uncharacterized protein YlxP (DUF503 family)